MNVENIVGKKFPTLENDDWMKQKTKKKIKDLEKIRFTNNQRSGP